MNRFLSAFLIVGTILGTPALAKDSPPKELGKFKDWTAYSMTQNGKKVCYAVTYPLKSECKNNRTCRRGDIYVMVAHRPAEKSYNVFSFNAGYPFAAGGTVAAKVDTQKYTLYTDTHETAWAPNDQDKKITQALARGKSLVIEGESSKKTKTEDKFSLRGSKAALLKIQKECAAS